MAATAATTGSSGIVGDAVGVEDGGTVPVREVEAVGVGDDEAVVVPVGVGVTVEVEVGVGVAVGVEVGVWVGVGVGVGVCVGVVVGVGVGVGVTVGSAAFRSGVALGFAIVKMGVKLTVPKLKSLFESKIDWPMADWSVVPQ